MRNNHEELSHLHEDATKQITFGKQIIEEACKDATVGSPALSALFDVTYLFHAKWNLRVAETNMSLTQQIDNRVIADHAAAQATLDTISREIDRNIYAIAGYQASVQKIYLAATAIASIYKTFDGTTHEQKTYEDLQGILHNFHPVLGKRK